MLIENLGNPVFWEKIWNIFAYSLIGSMGMLCSFLCMICLLGVVHTVTVKRVLLYLAPVVACPLIGGIIGCFFRFTEESNKGNTILQILVMSIFFLYFFLVSFKIYEKPKVLRTLEHFLTFAGLILYIGSLYVAWALLRNDSTLIMEIFQSLTFRSILMKTNIVFFFLISLVLITIGLYAFLYRNQRFYRYGVPYIIVLISWSIIVNSISIAAINDEDETIRIMRYILIFLLNFISLMLPVSLCLNGYRKALVEKNRYQESYLESELLYIERYKKSQDRTRSFRHDMTNNLSVLLYLINEGKKEEAGVYLNEMLGQVQNMEMKYVTGDEMLDCIVAMKAEKMEKVNIRFSLEGKLESGLHRKPLEICMIFSNLLDNAIEAQERILDPQKEKWVKMTIKKTDQFWVINICHSTDGLADNDKRNLMHGYTSNKNVQYHGLGLHDIKQAVEEKGGIVKFEALENSFVTSVMLSRTM